MMNEQDIRSAIDNAITNSDLDDLVNDYNAKEKISKIIQDAIVAALQAYNRQQKQQFIESGAVSAASFSISLFLIYGRE